MGDLLPLVVAMTAAGYLMRRLGVVRAEAAKDLNQVVFYVTLPPLTFAALHKADLSWSLLVMPATAWALTAVGTGLGLFVGRALKLPRPAAGALAIAMAFGNTTFFGYPVVESFYGAPGLTLAIFYDLLGATVATNTLGVFVASAYGGERPSEVKALVRRLLTFPAIWALGLGLALHGAPLPTSVEGVLTRIGALTSPLIMLSIGLQLRFEGWREDLPLVALASAVRLLLLPALVLLALTALGLSAEYRRVAVMQAAMPTMFFSLTLAMVFGLRANLAVHAIMVSTLLSFATLPLWRLALG